ncbi:phage antirepressor KilAC domain-containing protein [Scatolibacter rhodanostii]|uniref:phage antirepressor KilAC domain-containing protein n=1 Tax=Scatolibacter rhodanostii TaxID=2014781 RepID=UPI000C085157|nr:phage antirepressor KilAC domain-containing protein [Scatolibacter rhodanostii]
MNNLIPVNYESDKPTVSARELHQFLEVKTAFKDWFPRMTEYGFEELSDFAKLPAQKRATNNPKNPWTEITDYQLTIDMAKEVCMIQRNERGKQARQYFVAVENAWNSPEKIMARALNIAQAQISSLHDENHLLLGKIEQDKPKVLFAEAVATSQSTILVGQLAKLLKQNGIDIGQNRLFEWLRQNGYLIRQKGNNYNLPTQRAMDMELFRIKESTHFNGDGVSVTTKTTKVTGKGQQYFIEKFLSEKTA